MTTEGQDRPEPITRITLSDLERHTERKRLPAHTFGLPIAELRMGYYAARYFDRTRHIALDNTSAQYTMQVFQKRAAVLCGIDEAIAILKLGTGCFKDWEKAGNLFSEYRILTRAVREHHSRRNTADLLAAQHRLADVDALLEDLWIPKCNELEVSALFDGDDIEPWESVMHITGPLGYFAHLESNYLGALARRTLVATNVRECVKAANGKRLLCFADRFDSWQNSTGDGYAAHVGGIAGVACPSMGEWWGAEGEGTMPHALIAYFDGDVVAACRAFHTKYPKVPIIALVDFHNNCVRESLDVARAFKAEGIPLYGVRLDTSGTMVDASIIENDQMGQETPTGVNPLGVWNVRDALDGHNFEDVKIVVSGGFRPSKIQKFEEEGVPVDAYGVGSGLLCRNGSEDFTADIVEKDGGPCAKVGRKYRDSFADWGIFREHKVNWDLV